MHPPPPLEVANHRGRVVGGGGQQGGSAWVFGSGGITRVARHGDLGATAPHRLAQQARGLALPSLIGLVVHEGASARCQALSCCRVALLQSKQRKGGTTTIWNGAPVHVCRAADGASRMLGGKRRQSETNSLKQADYTHAHTANG